MNGMNTLAIYNGPGVKYDTTIERRWLSIKGLNITVLNHNEFTRENLDKFNLIILPGGSGSGICKGLGLNGKQELIDWVSDGGIIIGVCAGMFALSKGYTWSLGLINYHVVDNPFYRRGDHPVNLTITNEGREFLGLRRKVFDNVPYRNGPVVNKIDYNDFNVMNEKILAYFDSEWKAEGGKEGLMRGTPAIICNNYRNGLIIAISPHLEASSKYRGIIIKLIKKLLK